MRLFLGFAPQSAERGLFSLGDRLGLARDADLRAVPPENWHITLVFLGEVPEHLLGRLSDVVSRAAEGAAPLCGELDRLAWFPSALKPRLLALLLSAPLGLWELEATVTRRLRAEGFHCEHRDYRPHLTLARLPQSQRSFVPPPLPPVAALPVELDAIGLYQSWRGERPYRLLQQFELG
ncbi:MAG: RNA 2',3'-cyclic phosphodiesterase [Halieaceae bacterium]|jgi:2'-5' RNA ligase|nr:RNA 2',3'-cyclic phosphodiesterase [Halieaceae bacterium]